MGELKTITKSEFDKKMELHRLWVDEIEGGERASFSGEHFDNGIDMSCMDLRHVDFSGAHFTRTSFRGAQLISSDLSGAHMSGVDFTGACMRESDLTGASIKYSNFDNAILNRAILKDAEIHGTNMMRTSMVRAVMENALLDNVNMRWSDLSGADFGGSNLWRVNMSATKLSMANFASAGINELCCFNGASMDDAIFTSASISKSVMFDKADIYGCEFDGEERNRLGRILDHPIKGYKRSGEGDIVTLEIPAGAVVFSINNGKCRTNIAKVVDTGGEAELRSSYDPRFKYRVGEELRAKDFCMAYNVECESGIHFYKTREEAVRYKI